jgi:hypothetical protein
MKTIWNEPERQELLARIARLSPDARPRWGRMSVHQMLVHLCDAFRMASGDLVIPSKNVPLRFTPLKQLFIYWLPMPKGAPTAKELVSRQPGDWDAEMRELAGRLDEFVRRGPAAAATASHPAFGRMSGRDWGVLAYKHTDHHLRQFGV